MTSRVVWHMLVLVCVVTLTTKLHAADFCDKDLAGHPDPTLPYQMRGDRCEGRYISEKSTRGSFLIASLTSNTNGARVSKHAVAEIHWRAIGAEDVHIRAFSLERRIYFQMDTFVHGGLYRWPLDLAAESGLSGETIGVVAEVTRSQISAQQLPLYVPVTISGAAKASAPPTVILTIFPAIELSEVFQTIIPVLHDGQLGKALLKAKPLQYGYYPAERSVQIPLGELSAGLYFVEISAQLAPGGTAASSFQIRIPVNDK